MKSSDRKQPEAGDVWINTVTGEKVKILAIAFWDCEETIIAGSPIKFVVYHAAVDELPAGAAIVKPARIGWGDRCWQLSGIDLVAIAKDDIYSHEAALTLANSIWEHQEAKIFALPHRSFMEMIDEHEPVWFLLEEGKPLEEGDRVSISLPAVSDEIFCTVESVTNGKVLAVFQDGEAGFKVEVGRDRVVKLA